MKDRVIMTRLGTLGRFGNSLYQYMFLKTYALKNHLRLEVPEWVGRKLFVVPEHDKYISSSLSRLKDRGTDAKTNVFVRKVRRNVDVDGFFQFHTSYYRPYRNYVRRLFSPRPEIKCVLDQALVVKVRNRRLFAVHLRRGDWLKFGFVGPTQWYVDCLEKMWEEGSCLYVASDELDVVLSAFEKFRPITCRDLNVQVVPEFYVDFYVLTQSEVLLTSNSSFSHVASMLNEKAKVFYRPRSLPQRLVEYDPWDSEVYFKNG